MQHGRDRTNLHQETYQQEHEARRGRYPDSGPNSWRSDERRDSGSPWQLTEHDSAPPTRSVGPIRPDRRPMRRVAVRQFEDEALPTPIDEGYPERKPAWSPARRERLFEDDRDRPRGLAAQGDRRDPYATPPDYRNYEREDRQAYRNERESPQRPQEPPRIERRRRDELRARTRRGYNEQAPAWHEDQARRQPSRPPSYESEAAAQQPMRLPDPGYQDMRWSPRDRRSEPRVDHRGKGPKGYRRSAERIREDVCESLTDARVVDASGIEVKVSEQGVVTLEGRVDNRHSKKAAELEIESLRGVRDVFNLIEIDDD